MSETIKLNDEKRNYLIGEIKTYFQKERDWKSVNATIAPRKQGLFN